MTEPSSPGAEPAQRIAAFDFDGTITWTDSFVLFLRRVHGRAGLARRLGPLAGRFAGHAAGIVSRERIKAAVVRACLRGMPLTVYRELCADFAETVWPLIARDDALSRIAAHASAGEEAIIVSASLEDYLVPMAARAGIATVLATRLEVVDGVLTGALAGRNCWGPEKVARLRAARPGARLSAAYGDTRGDREMLAAADAPGLRVFTHKPADGQARLRAALAGRTGRFGKSGLGPRSR